ncbi:competence/damage-inducible protein A [Candidatus Thorarchaeota archaeon]|nr:MAG: competence/damage-inducible protein A [Candidatus Thorarchaeota archaeon]
MNSKVETVGIIAIGNEVLDGLVLDTNSNWMELRLVALGLSIKRLVSVRDDLDEIGKALGFLQEICDVIITTGGLGPTHDDMTLKAIALALDRDIEENIEALEIVERQYKTLYEKGIVQSPEITDARRKMAYVPKGATPLDNQVGGAPGVMIHDGDNTIFCLPGVPSELKFIFEDSILPWISERVKRKFYEKVVEFGMHDESTFAPSIDIVMKKYPGVYIKSMPKTYGTSKSLRVWISAAGDDREELEQLVLNAIESLEETTGIPSRIIKE